MFGQGRPSHSTWRLFGRHRRWKPWTLGLTPWMVLLCAATAVGADWDVRLRVAWGGGEARSWNGTIRITEGTLSDPMPLGLEADCPGSMHATGPSTIVVLPRTPRSYDGLDLHVQAPQSAMLLIDLSAPGEPPLGPLEIPLEKILKGVQQFELDEFKNRVLVQRTPGDALRVTLERDSLVFKPNEKLKLDVLPSDWTLNANSAYLLTATLHPARSSQELWREEFDLKTDDQSRGERLPLVIPLPAAEGVFDLRLALFPKRLATSILRGKPLLERRVQVVTIAEVKAVRREPIPWEPSYELDPANPRWWERMARLPTLRRLPNLSSPGAKQSSIRSHLGRQWVQLPPEAWQAFPLTIASPGMPHVLEVEYPSDLEQTLLISLIEPNAAGRVSPIGLDSGVEVPPPSAGHKAKVSRHRLVFWPKTKSPYVLLVNRRTGLPAVFGKITVESGPNELPAIDLPPTGFPTRTLAAWMDKPLIAENFSATEALDPATARSRTDWLTFYDAGTRLVETLQHGGYNAVVLTVAGEGSSLYPSKLLQPTPAKDTGTFYESGQDPVRKDVVELLHRLCDRAGIQLISGVQFTAPLPELEQMLIAKRPPLANEIAGDAEAKAEPTTGIEPIGADGRSWIARHGVRGGMGVYYNALDPRVQQSMERVIAELGQRYGHHASFGGVAVQWSPESYSALPDATASYDDATIARFERETEVSIPNSPRGSFEDRALFLYGTAEKSWLAWRAEKMTAMYQRMQADLSRSHSGARLYLAGADLLASQQIQQSLRPLLPPVDEDPGYLLLQHGLNVSRLASLPDIVVPRPQRAVPAALEETHDLQQHLASSSALDSLFAPRGSGSSLVLHEPALQRLPDFDAVSPFGPEKTHLSLVSQISSSGAAARQRLVHAVAALDSPTLLSGGWLLPLGQEKAIRSFATVFRRLPEEPFNRAEPKSVQNAQGVIVRSLAMGAKTYFYVVNDSPWPVAVAIDFSGAEAERIVSYAEDRAAQIDQQSGTLTWTVDLEPYDLAGGELTSGKASISDYRVTLPADAAQTLSAGIREVRLRANALRSPQAVADLANSSFETKGEGIPGWMSNRGPGVVVDVDITKGFESASSLHLASRPPAAGQPAPIVWARSQPFPAPTTGRLTISARIKLLNPAKQPKLRLAVQWKLDGRTYYKFATVGSSENGAPVTPLTDEWATYRCPITDLPLAELKDFQIGFDLMGEGEVWIDEVQVHDLWFDDKERAELLKTIALADYQLSAGHVHDGQRFVDGYWPTFLRRHVALPENVGPGNNAAAEANKGGVIAARLAKPKVPAPPPTMLDRIRSWMPGSSSKLR